MSKLTKHLTLSAITLALAGGMGAAFAQSASTGNGSTGNPDPNATLGTPAPADTPTDETRADRENRNRVNDRNPGAYNGEAADNTFKRQRGEPQPGDLDMNHNASEPPTRGESARSNNSYGHSRDTN